MDVINSSKSYKKIDKLIIKFDQVPSGYEHGSPSHAHISYPILEFDVGIGGRRTRRSILARMRANETFNKKMKLGSGFSIVTLTKRAPNFN